MGVILDLSHHQLPNTIDYDKVSKQVDLVIIRTQYGSNVIDKAYKTHHQEFQKRGIPTAAYAWVRGVNIADMQVEATDFYNRTKEFNPTIWFLDVEEQSMTDMRNGVSAYVHKLRELGANKVGIYVANHLYKQFNLNVDEVDAVWIPSYGKNDGTPCRKPDYNCHLWQFTSLGTLDGHSGGLDLSIVNGDKPIEYFTGKTQSSPTTISSDEKPLQVVKVLVESDVRAEPSHTSAFIGNVHKGQIYNVWKRQGDWHFVVLESGTNKEGWVDGNNGANLQWVDNPGNAQPPVHIIAKGETLSKIATLNGTTVAELCKLNDISNPDKIYVGQKITLK